MYPCINSLYHLVGYNPHSVENALKVCWKCLDRTKCKPDEEVKLKNNNRLLKLNEYKEGALVAVNPRRFEFIQIIEETSRKVQISFMDTPALKECRKKSSLLS